MRAIRYGNHTPEVCSLPNAKEDSARGGLTKAQVLLSAEPLPCNACAAAAAEVLLQRCAALLGATGTAGPLPPPPCRDALHHGQPSSLPTGARATQR